MENPFKINTISFNDWKILKDLNWHCTKCELKSGQAKTWQVWRQNGIQLDIDSRGNYFLKQICSKCNNNTIHRKLKTLEILEETNIRSGISIKLSKRIKDLYNNIEAVFLREMPSKELEIDHKFPQVRWESDEEKYLDNIDDTIIKSKFILLTRANNLLKSRYCEKCKKNNIRGNFPGIYFWYQGNEKWQGKNEYDENGCIGCFWYDPFKWREELNKIVNK